MYKINLHYQSETRGVYSSEEIVTLALIFRRSG